MDRNEKQNSYRNMVSTRGNGRELSGLKKRVNILTVIIVILTAAVIALSLLTMKIYFRESQGSDSNSAQPAVSEKTSETMSDTDKMEGSEMHSKKKEKENMLQEKMSERKEATTESALGREKTVGVGLGETTRGSFSDKAQASSDGKISGDGDQL